MTSEVVDMFPSSLSVGGVDFTMHKDGDLEIDLGTSDGRWNGRYLSADDWKKVREWLRTQR